MALRFEDLMLLWSQPLPEGDAAVAKFAKFYADPVWVNGAEMPLRMLVDRARATQATFADLSARIIREVDTIDHKIVVFRMGGRHVGPLSSPLGEVAPTGKVVERQIIDVLEHKDGLITKVWMVGDELGALLQMGALKLA